MVSERCSLDWGTSCTGLVVVYVASVVSAVLFWLIGRACKYFLAGE
jgi:hypothetical protein